jgi:hypothetical protein
MGDGKILRSGGRDVTVLSLEQQLVATCAGLHAAPAVSVVHLRDVAQLALAPGIDGRRARRVAEATGSTEALAATLVLAWGTFDLADKTDLSVWASRMTGHGPVGATTRRPFAAVRGPGIARRVLGRRQPAPRRAVATLRRSS